MYLCSINIQTTVSYEYFYAYFFPVRGYYVRVKAINEQVITFLKTHSKSQIISLGAGFDTLYFRLFDYLTSSTSQVFEVYRISYLVYYQRIYHFRLIFQQSLHESVTS